MAGRRRKPKPQLDPNVLEGDQLDGLTYPTLRSTWEGVDPEELERRHERARQLVVGGWGAVQW